MSVAVEPVHLHHEGGTVPPRQRPGPGRSQEIDMEFVLTYNMPAEVYERNARPENVEAAMAPWKLFYDAD